MRHLASNLEALDASDPFDICIIGAGPAGIVLAKRMVEGGFNTLILDSGRGIIDWAFNKELKKLAEYEFTGNTNYPLVYTAARIVGGNSVFWTGRAERFQPSDFDNHPYLPAENPWPVRYSELEPYYLRAEKTLRVRGGKLSEFMPPRTEDLPVPPSPDITSLKQLMSRAGVVVDDSPTATPRRAFRFFRANKEILPEFQKSPNFTLVTGVTATKLDCDQDGRIVGAQVQTLDGVKKTAKARTYIVACGGLQTPRLLLLSKSDRFPNGIGNNFDRVGRGFNEHPGINYYGKIRHNLNTIYPRHKVGRTHQFYEIFRPQGLGSVHPVFIQSWVFPHHLLKYRLIDMPKHFLKILGRMIQPTLHIGATIEMRPRDENRVTLSASRKDIFGNPIAHLMFSFNEEDSLLIESTRKLQLSFFEKIGATDIEELNVITFSRHHIGTCRMGDNPKTSVVDRYLRVHETKNLYLCGCEVYVTGAAVPPLLTSIAFVHRLADHLEQLFRQKDISIVDMV